MAIAVALWLGLGSAVFASTGEDIKQLKALLRSMGTSVVNKKCRDRNLWGFYELNPDRITICINGKISTSTNIGRPWLTNLPM